MDILGFEQTVKGRSSAVYQETAGNLCKISSKIIEVNMAVLLPPFFSWRRRKLTGLKDEIPESPSNGIKACGHCGATNFQTNTFFCRLWFKQSRNMPLLLALSFLLANLINDSFRVILNGRPAKLFRSGSLRL